ncbi:hypothetical protein NG798_18105 [Ancylothrix sp. C2]|uniref:hypothetical protein n=1 Tax=Ancylothrix sp. D3o TaxID=2953691 RepID=UPI0021BB3C32|nr:hypothetical protein [Ancylothrix sp. D3o]MCT7951720.1 hypothetical protein [Ancylothrix sp. D3o]
MGTLIKSYGVTAIVIAVVLSACGPSSPKKMSRFEIYRNKRYNFEFPYPAEWIADTEPANRDGQAFSEPKNPDIQIRGWASNRQQEDKQAKQYPAKETEPLKQNFSTQQGTAGNLKVEIGTEISSITLTLKTADIQYNWRAQTPNQRFSEYYPLFYRLAGQYKINPQP